MRNNKIIFGAFALAFSFFSCSDSDHDGLATGSDPIKFATTINVPQQKTRAAGDAWAANDAIGVYMLKTGETLGGSGVTALTSNVHYQATAAGANAQFEGANNNQIYFPQNGGAVDFVAYYPYQSTVDGFKVPVDVSNQAVLENIDLMYSNDAVNMTSSTLAADVKLNFKHQLTNITFNITDENGSPLAGTTVTIKNLATKTNMLLGDGSLEAGTAPADIATNVVATGNKAVAQAIVVPMSSTAITVEFKLPGATAAIQSKTLDAAVYDAGHRYIYTATVKAGTTEVEVKPTADIVDWIDVPMSDEIELEADKVGTGTQASPYSVLQALTKAGETGKWVEGYVVGVATSARSIEGDFSSFDTDANILIAASASETDPTKCIPVDLDDADIKKSLNLKDNPSLVGKLVKVQGNIVASVYGAVAGITAVTAQEGGVKERVLDEPIISNLLADTYVQNGGGKDTNFNGENVLKFRNGANASDDYQTFLKASLADMKNLETGKEVAKVELSMYINYSNAAVEDQLAWIINPVNDITWDEATLTYSTKPAHDERIISSVQGVKKGTDAERYIVFDITDYAKEEVAKEKDEMSLRLFQGGDKDKSHMIEVFSTERNHDRYSPRLHVYTADKQ